jgi:hypothetical protein
MTAEIIGKTWKADFGPFAFHLEFHSETSLSFRAVQPDGTLADATTVEITRTELRPDLWLVSWKEPSIQATVVHVQDFENGAVWTHISRFVEQEFVRLEGRLTPLTRALDATTM